MKINLRRILFTSGLIVILVAIAIVCLIIGRGHTIYFDNKALESYQPYSSIDVYYNGEKVTTLGADERASITLTGQNLEIQFKIQKTDGSISETHDEKFELPYDLDGIVINIPAYYEGADVNTYLKEFVAQNVEEDVDDEVPVTDEFGINVDE